MKEILGIGGITFFNIVVSLTCTGSAHSATFPTSSFMHFFSNNMAIFDRNCIFKIDRLFQPALIVKYFWNKKMLILMSYAQFIRGQCKSVIVNKSVNFREQGKWRVTS
ncbi:MAG: hypothetical protein JWQ40_2465 [Segetibacter sp.]|nr:hypothetical protein [Segetibacter sp.]